VELNWPPLPFVTTYSEAGLGVGSVGAHAAHQGGCCTVVLFWIKQVEMKGLNVVCLPCMMCSFTLAIC
jgi:hypothetical protein